MLILKNMIHIMVVLSKTARQELTSQKIILVCEVHMPVRSGSSDLRIAAELNIDVEDECWHKVRLILPSSTQTYNAFKRRSFSIYIITHGNRSN